MSRIFFTFLVAALGAVGGAQGADIRWIGGTGDWSAAGNWDIGQVPGPADNAIITNSATYTVTVPNAVDPAVASLTLGGAGGIQTLSLGRSILTLNGASVVNPNGRLVLTVGNSTVTGAGSLTVDGTLVWDSGTMSGAGVTSIGSNGVLTINGGVTLTTRTLNNGGHATWASGNFTAGSGAVINNLADGVFDVAFDGRLSVAAAPAVFNNAGLLRKTLGTASASINAPLHNSGTVQVLAATLSLDGGGTNTGAFTAGAGATLNLGGGSHVLAVSSVVTTGTVVTLGGGATLSGGGVFRAGSTLNLISGVATLAATCDVTAATLGINGANCVLNYNSAGPAGAINLTQGTLGGLSPVTVTGLLALSGGSVTNALVTANGGIAFSGGVTLSGARLVNPATAIWSLGNITGANGSVFSNLFGATFINTFDGNMGTAAGTLPVFINQGTFKKTGGTLALGATSIDWQFINTGTVQVQTNTLRYAVNQQTAGLTLLEGGGLAAQAQPLQFLGGTLMGTGLVTLANTQTLTNSAIINPGLPLGELDVVGNYQQTVLGGMNIELGGYEPGSNYDRITVTGGGAGGVATLGGTLNVSLTNGFSPTNGATFTFLTAVSRVGAFATFNYPSNDLGLLLSYDLTSARITVSNLKPVLTPIPDQMVDELTSFALTATATDPDLPAQTLTFALVKAPAGMTISPSSGLITWIPSQAQSPSTNTVTVRVTDNGTPPVSATTSFAVIVREVNVAPVLPAIGAQAINELNLLTVTNTASEANLHSTVGYALVNPPAGAAIDAAGVITWTPGEAQGPGTFTLTTVATATNQFDLVNPQLKTTNSFTVAVDEVNVAPVLAVPAPQTVDVQVVSFAFSPKDVTIKVGDTVRWTQQATFTHTVTSGTGCAPDGLWNSGSLTSVGQQFSHTFTNSGSFPYFCIPHCAGGMVGSVTVTASATQTVNELTLLSVSAAATDADLPANPLTFALVAAPEGMSINSGSGLINWTPSQAQSPSTNLILVSVTDTNPPAVNAKSLSVTNSFTVIVREVNVAPGLPAVGPQSVNELTLLTVTNTASEANLHSTVGYALVNPPAGAAIDAAGVITWTPGEAQGPGTFTLTTIATASNRFDLVNPQLKATNSFTVAVNEVNVAPVLVVPADRTVNELTLLSVSAAATDTDLPANPRTFALVAAPEGMSINSGSGMINWIPSQAQRGSTNLIQVSVTDTNPPAVNAKSLSATGSFTVVVYAPPQFTLQPLGQITQLGSNVTLQAAAAGFPPPAYQWRKQGFALADATNDQYAISQAQLTDAGSYQVVATNAAGAVTSGVAVLVVNRPPVPAAPVLARRSYNGGKLPVADFLGSDPDGDAISMISVGPAAQPGATVTNLGGWITYSPAAAGTNEDAFPFTVSDGRGGFATSTGLVTVIADNAPAQNLTREDLGNGRVRLKFDVLPGRNYTVQYAESLAAPNWQTLANLAADAVGQIICEDQPPPAAPPRFYRAVIPSP